MGPTRDSKPRMSAAARVTGTSDDSVASLRRIAAADPARPQVWLALADQLRRRWGSRTVRRMPICSTCITRSTIAELMAAAGRAARERDSRMPKRGCVAD